MHPMKLSPAFQDYLWGGTRLVEHYGKQTSLRPVAESWEVSIHPNGPSTVENGLYAGQTLAQVLKAHPEFLGRCVPEFPVLIKLIDAAESLSVQVHPNDAYAKEHENSQGKNEMWYVMEATPEAKLYLGLKKPLSQSELERHIKENTLLNEMNAIPVSKGDCFAVPAGLLHAIGAGTLVAEIQQNSDITYRVYDYGRTDAKGNPRKLHIPQALAVTDTSLTAQNLRENAVCQSPGCLLLPLLDWEFFHVEQIHVQTLSQHFVSENTFQALIVVDGMLTYRSPDSVIPLEKGTSLFLPAGLGEYTLQGPGTVLMVKAFGEDTSTVQ